MCGLGFVASIRFSTLSSLFWSVSVMPQPLSSRGVKTLVTGNITTERPALAGAALRIIANASEADFALARALLNISPNSAKQLAELFSSQENDAKKGATISAIATTHLNAEMLALFKRIERAHRSMRKERTPFAHWIYAYSNERPDLLILIDPKKELLTEADLAYIHRNWLNFETLEPATAEDRTKMTEARDASMKASIDAAQSYDLAELEEIAKRFQMVRVCFEFFLRLVNWVGAREGHDALSQVLEEYLRPLE